MKQFLFLFTLLSVFNIAIGQQQGTIIGRVIDEKGAAFAGASVLVRGTRTGTSADSSGHFRINAKTGDVLVISAVGIPSKEIKVTAKSSLTVTLVRQSQSLAEVVVTAAGITRAQRSLGYATTTLKGDELTKARETNIVNSLAGKVAGVRITSQSGTVGGSSKIVIRGVSSIVGSSRIDGLPVDNSSRQVSTISTSSLPQGVPVQILLTEPEILIGIM